MKTATAPTGAVVITREGRGRLTQRLHDLDETVLPQLREQLWTKDRDWIVDPVEAPLDDVRVASTSPFARASLGRRVGEEIEIQPRVGPSFRYVIVGAWRHELPRETP
jgi:hypothetical protein